MINDLKLCKRNMFKKLLFSEVMNVYVKWITMYST